MKCIRMLLAASMLMFIFAGQVYAETIKPLSAEKRQEYVALSPFEFKNMLIDRAGENGKPILDAGRGNPNFLNTRSRLAFSMLHRFAVECSIRYDAPKDLGFSPTTSVGMADRFTVFLIKEPDKGTAKFLMNAMAYCSDKLGIAPDTFATDMVDAILGDHYPTPSRMLNTPATIVEAYLKSIHFTKGNTPAGSFDLFATEGATAAMIYVFNTLKENFILTPGDEIAIITPIFSPYLEIPVLKDFELNPIYVAGSENTDWQVSDEELNKLRSKKIKALFMVNPMNPGAVSMSAKSVQKIAELIKKERSDLIVLTDTVYCPFVNEFHDLLEAVPQNCIGVFSYSKYFGVTGWRLGVIFVNRRNIIDRMIAALPSDKTALLNRRYSIDSTEPEKIRFIDRLLMDSRDVALAHTGGLSTPQQCVMSLFALYDLLDSNHVYKKSIQSLLSKRMSNLYSSLKMDSPSGAEQTQYYNLVNILALAERLHGADFSKYLTDIYSPFGFLLELAARYQTILLPGVGFAGPEWSVRVSLANLPDGHYIAISKNLVALLDEYYAGWQNK
ncbi:MAG: bifunctional aspartate transaminase/aspartate 4-decarboxylase [Deltaproteobacteria bacterium]|nr:bifunctional aspartate transaminase/aspartate 4-decarboxylase [Deltaproteobacteria bacterium]